MDIVYETAIQLEKAIIERRDAITNATAAGSATDWADYRFRTGRIRGLNDALIEISALIERQEIRE